MKTGSPIAGSTRTGFSIIELVLTVTVIGVLAAVAIPNISSVSSASGTAVSKRNAQSIVNTFQDGLAAGVVWDTSGTRTETVDLVIAGAGPADGPYAGKIFKVGGVARADVAKAMPFIGKDPDGNLFYNGAGGITGP